MWTRSAIRSRLKIAFRNVRRNRRRTAFTVLAVGLGYAAIAVFGGFASYVAGGLRDGYVYAQARGHLTIVRAGTLEGRTAPGDRLIPESDRAAVTRILSATPDVILVTPELHMSGTAVFTTHAASFYGVGRVAADVAAINKEARGVVAGMKLFDGEPLDDRRPDNIGMTPDLAESLQLVRGAQIRIRVRSLGGRIEERDVRVVNLVPVPIEGADWRLVSMPLALAQDLLGTRSVDRFTVLLRRGADPERVRRRLSEQLAACRLDLQVRTLFELDPFSTKVAGMFRTIGLILAGIVFIVSMASVANTMGMLVLERAREIGTFRALGATRTDVVGLFALEAAMLGLLGCAAGIVLTVATWYGFHAFNPVWYPPYIGLPVPLRIDLRLDIIAACAALMVALAVAAGIPAALRAANRAIPDVLAQA